MVETISIFGATGRTGQHLVKLALEQGYHVRVLARNPSKLTNNTPYENLHVIQGDFANEPAIKETVKGATYVISVAGGPENNSYPRLFVNSFLKILLPILEQEKTVQTFLSTSVMFAVKPDGSLPWSVKIFKPMCALLGMGPAMEDHETNLKFLSENSSSNYQTIVARPGRLQELPSQRKLVPSDTPYFGQVAYQELAAYYLQAIKDADNLVDKFPFLVPVS
jgi:nucleoside-diphosphate-sugar epimerase